MRPCFRQRQTIGGATELYYLNQLSPIVEDAAQAGCRLLKFLLFVGEIYNFFGH